MDDNSLNKDVKNAIKVLEKGGVILYPTDTIWGIGCDATNRLAVEKIYRIKKREQNKSMIVLLDNMVHLSSYLENIPSIAYEMLLKADCPLTIIYPEAKNLAENVIAFDGSIAIRIPDNEFCQKLIRTFGKPIVSTSANFSGEPSAISFDNISANILSQMDYIVQFNQNQIIKTKPSRIVKLNKDVGFVVIRE
ncbi:MAG: threonylcarbamoyl-AMP synthase [Bacteroidetes bacterium]|nr:threonylcarbamoyl-AMP synthase [Bacteroidota bacterium]